MIRLLLEDCKKHGVPGLSWTIWHNENSSRFVLHDLPNYFVDVTEWGKTVCLSVVCKKKHALHMGLACRHVNVKLFVYSRSE